MTALSIDRLVIDAPHLSGVEGERLASLVLDGLAAARFPGKSSGILNVTVKDVGAGSEALAGQIVDEVIRQMKLVG